MWECVCHTFCFDYIEKNGKVKVTLTYFPEFDGALKLLSGHNEEDSQVDARV